MVVANLVVKSLVILQSVVMRLISFCFSLLTAILFITSYIWPAYLRTLIFMTIKNEWYVLPASSSYPMVAVYPVCKYWWKGSYWNAILPATLSDPWLLSILYASTDGKEATGMLLCSLQLLTGSFFSSPSVLLKYPAAIIDRTYISNFRKRNWNIT